MRLVEAAVQKEGGGLVDGSLFTSRYNELMRFGDLEERQVHPSHPEEGSG